jgi:hypothetical protein
MQKGTLLGEVYVWLEDHHMKVIDYKFQTHVNQYGRTCLDAVSFGFLSETDAVAFKIRWIGK